MELLVYTVGGFTYAANDIVGTFHRTDMHAGQVFTNNAQGEELRPGENGDDRSQEREAWYASSYTF